MDLDLDLDLVLDLDLEWDLDLSLDVDLDLRIDLEHRPGSAPLGPSSYGGGWDVELWAGQNWLLPGWACSVS